MEEQNLNTPMMHQYLEIKKKYRDEVLFYRMGDFYEMFLEDAVYASRVLDIALTKRQDKIPMCGIPHHAWQNYVQKILKDGRKIAICEQTEDPKLATGKIVKREVVRILTPGSIYEEELLSGAEKNTLGVFLLDKDSFLFLSADLSTGTLSLDSGDGWSQIPDKLLLHSVREVVLIHPPKNIDMGIFSNLPVVHRQPPPLSSSGEGPFFERHLGISNPGILEISEKEKSLLVGFFRYLEEISPLLKMRWKMPVRVESRKTMKLDENALRTLEILEATDGSRNASLFSILNETKSAHGKRLLAEFLSMPSLDKVEIERRLDVTQWLATDNLIRKSVRNFLADIHDLERILISLNHRPDVRHLGQIRDSLRATFLLREKITATVENSKNPESLPAEIREFWLDSFDFPRELMDSLENALREELPPLLDERPFLKPGFSSMLDELVVLNDNAFTVLKKFEEDQKSRYNIPTLKVKYNRVIGYFIEISKGAKEKPPESYHRRQTLVNGERYTCEELKNIEDKILHAKENILEIQKGIFQSFVSDILEETARLRKLANALARLDVFQSFAEIAGRRKYIRPIFNTEGIFSVKDSRHPVIEEIFRSEIFVPNDIELDKKRRHLAIITGPNMSGKSTYIRQTGLLSIMAQAGSFVPAAWANLPLVDRIFTRIGAYDRLAKGESTFYVEMKECAGIFHYMTPSSLVLLDEVGRGTSTYDGISIARAMIEFLNQESSGKPLVLFATHYGELSEMIAERNGIVGLTVSVLEENNEIIFLRKIVEGVADKSYGIYVAKLAGLPVSITERAEALLEELEEKGFWEKKAPGSRKKTTQDDSTQLHFF